MRHWKTLLAAAGLALASGAASADALDDGEAQGMLAMVGHFGAGEVATAFRFLDAAPEGLSADALGQSLVLRRHFDTAALFYLLALAPEKTAVRYNNFAATLALAWLPAQDDWPADTLDVALKASRTATEQAPDKALFHNTRGSIARLAGFADEALAEHKHAAELAGDEPLYWINLARDLDRAGDDEGTKAAFARAFALASADPPVRVLRRDLAARPAWNAAIFAGRCDIDFRCDEICPRSIIGGLKNVQCEMENMSARIACSEGRLHPLGFDCRENFPDYGILIPGLNSGFSVLAPGFKMHVLFDGQGNVDFRWEANIDFGPYRLLGAHLGSDGHLGKNMPVVLDRFQTGLDLELLPDGLGDLDLTDDADLPLAGIMSRGGETGDMAVQLFGETAVTF